MIAAGPKTYDIEGVAGHKHDVTLTQELIDTLLQAKTVEIAPTVVFGHSHVVKLEIVRQSQSKSPFSGELTHKLKVCSLLPRGV